MHHQEQPKKSITVSSRKALPPPKFSLSDRVYWFRVPTKDFGTVIERFYRTEGSVQKLGWHYTIRLDPDSPSFEYCKAGCGFEEDLALVEAGETNALE
jgi:hypothetical protein